jgi:hypothetical protein
MMYIIMMIKLYVYNVNKQIFNNVTYLRYAGNPLLPLWLGSVSNCDVTGKSHSPFFRGDVAAFPTVT